MATKADGSVIVDTKINSSAFSRGVDEMKSAISGLGGTIKKVGIAIGAAFSAKLIADFGRECLELGSDLAEVQNVVDVTFPNMTKRVDEFAKSSADAFGLSETMAKKYVGTFGAMAKSFGYSEEAAYDMSTALTGLTGDVASFYNLSQEEAYTKLKSVFTGETETLKELGVVMTQSALDQYALAKGYGKTTAKMTEQEKVGLRLKFVQEQLTAANGDFARTSDSWANQVRIMQLRLQSLKATIGQGLINIFTPIIKAINLFLQKLSVAANAFKSFTEMVIGIKSENSSGMKKMQEQISGVSDGYTEAADGAEDFSDGVQDANKAVKKSLAPFDDLIQLQGDMEENLTEKSADVSFSLPDEFSDDSNVKEPAVLSGVSDLLDKIKGRLLELKNIFSSGFWDGLGNYKPFLAELKSDLAKIGGYLKDIFTDANVQAAAKRFVDSFVYMVGTFMGMLTSLGLTMAVNIVGGIESYLSSNVDRIKAWIIRMFDVGTEINTIFSNFFIAFADVFSVFASQTAQDITGSIIQIFADVFGGILELTLKFTRDVLDMMLTPFIENKEKIKSALIQTLEPIKVVVQSLADTVRKAVDKIVALYDEHIHPFFESIKNGLSDLLEKLLDAYEAHIVPILDKLAAKFKEVMEGPVGDAINSAIEFLGKLVDALKFVWEEAFVPFISWIIENIVPVIAPIIETLLELALNFAASVADLISGVLDVLSGLIDFVVGVFSGDWTKAWNGVKQVFESVWNLIIKAAETGIGNIISLIKGLLDAAKEAAKAIASLFEGKSASQALLGNASKFGRNAMAYSAAPQMAAYAAIPYNPPMLATGTVVPPRAGISYFGIGDNNKEPEVVSPLSTMVEAFKQAMAETGLNGNRPINIEMQVKGQTFARLVYEMNNEERQRVGVRMVTQNG